RVRSSRRGLCRANRLAAGAVPDGGGAGVETLGRARVEAKSAVGLRGELGFAGGERRKPAFALGLARGRVRSMGEIEIELEVARLGSLEDRIELGDRLGQTGNEQPDALG